MYSRHPGLEKLIYTNPIKSGIIMILLGAIFSYLELVQPILNAAPPNMEVTIQFFYSFFTVTIFVLGIWIIIYPPPKKFIPLSEVPLPTKVRRVLALFAGVLISVIMIHILKDQLQARGYSVYIDYHIDY